MRAVSELAFTATTAADQWSELLLTVACIGLTVAIFCRGSPTMSHRKHKRKKFRSLCRPAPARTVVDLTAGNTMTPDEFLRSFGFKIHARPRDKPAVWRKGRNYYSQKDAMSFVERQRELPVHPSQVSFRKSK